MSDDDFGLDIDAFFGDEPTPAPAPAPAPTPAPAASTSSNRKDRPRGDGKPPPPDETYEAAETVEEVETTVPMTPQQQLAAAEKARDAALAAIAEERRIREEAAKTPEGRRRDRAEKAIQERSDDSLDIQIGTGPNPIFSTRQQARQATGGFMQEAQIPAAPTERETGKPITMADSIKRLGDRIRERKDEQITLKEGDFFRDPESPAGKKSEERRLLGLTESDPSRGLRVDEQMRRESAQRYAQIDREIKAMKQLKSELEAKQKADSAE